jgi:hypothetical protein
VNSGREPALANALRRHPTTRLAAAGGRPQQRRSCGVLVARSASLAEPPSRLGA